MAGSRCGLRTAAASPSPVPPTIRAWTRDPGAKAKRPAVSNTDWCKSQNPSHSEDGPRDASDAPGPNHFQNRAFKTEQSSARSRTGAAGPDSDLPRPRGTLSREFQLEDGWARGFTISRAASGNPDWKSPSAREHFERLANFARKRIRQEFSARMDMSSRHARAACG
jgi:hypothetical protein